MHTHTHTNTQTRRHPGSFGTGWPKYVGCLILIDHFPQKSPIISGTFAERDLQLTGSNASLPPCRMQGCFYKFMWSDFFVNRNLLRGIECVAVCCRVLQCVAVCCRVVQCVAMCCSVLQCVAVCCSVLQCVAVCSIVLLCVAARCSVLPAYCSVLQRVTAHCSVL